MEAYIKSFAAFTQIRQCKTTDYSLILDSLDSAKNSSVTVDGELPGTLAKAWLILNSIPMWISQVTPGKGLTKLTLKAAEEIFNRQLLADFNADRTAPEWNDTTVGGFMERIILRDWVNQSDGAFATPYIRVTNLDNTAFFPPELDDNGIYNLLEYIYKARQQFNITLHFGVERDGIRIIIRRDLPVTHPLVLGDGHTQLASSSFASSIVAKVTVIQPVEIPQEEPGEGEEEPEPIYEMTETDWYLSQDGTVSTTIPANRASGEWITIVISESDDQAERVQEEIAKNGESHKVELYSDQQMEVGDRFRILLNGELFEGTVIRKSIKRGDRRVLYTSGDLITTIQERVNRTAAAQQGGYTGDGTGQMYAVGDIYITTRQGNPAALLGYGAWEQIQGRFLLAVDASHSVGSKGGEAEKNITTEHLPDIDIVDTAEIYTRLATVSGSSERFVMANGSIITKKLGEAEKFEIMPPYFAVYVWLRKE